MVGLLSCVGRKGLHGPRCIWGIIPVLFMWYCLWYCLQEHTHRLACRGLCIPMALEGHVVLGHVLLGVHLSIGS